MNALHVLMRLLERVGRFIQPFILLFIRLYWGTGFIDSGWHKLLAPSAAAPFFESLHFPVPYFMVLLVGAIELIGGACLVIGLLTRFFTLPLIVIMTVALSTAHYSALESALSSYSLAPLQQESAFSYLIAMLVLFAFGAGLFSIDYLIERRAKQV